MNLPFIMRLLLTYIIGFSLCFAGDETPLTKNLKSGKHQHIVAYGTSLTARGAWVQQIEQVFDERYPDLVKITNSGGSGKHYFWGVDNLQKRVLDLKPDAVFIEFAMNDSVARFNISQANAKANLEAMIERIQIELPDCYIILQVMNPVIGRPKGHAGHRPHLDAYYQMYRDVAAARNLGLVDHAPAWKHVLEQGKAALTALVPDGLHPNAKGSEQITTPNILEMLNIKPPQK